MEARSFRINSRKYPGHLQKYLSRSRDGQLSSGCALLLEYQSFFAVDLPRGEGCLLEFRTLPLARRKVSSAGLQLS